MSAASVKLAELVKAGDELASACIDPASRRSDLVTLAQHWTILRGEMHHEAHLLLDELQAITRRAAGGQA